MRPGVKQVFFLMLLAGQWSGTVRGFSAEGHRVAGVIAESHLCPEAREYIAPLLDGASLADAGVWADSIRDDPAWAHTDRWHYINVRDRQKISRVAAASPDNVLSALERAERDLDRKDLSVRERGYALRFFVHFAADIHQPLHVGRPGDRGGNDVPVRWGSKSMNLHEVWDGRALLEAEGLGSAELAAAIGALATGQEEAWGASPPLGWATESMALRPVVYDLPQAAKGSIRLDDRYLVTARNVVSIRLAQAGARIAARLNRLACPGRPGQPGPVPEERPADARHGSGPPIEPTGPSH